MLPGIDVSHYQEVIDWPKVARSGVRFAYLKATQGASFVDPKLAENYAGAVGAGIAVGLYHVFIANTGFAQIANWSRENAKYPSQLPAWLDIEPGALTEEAAPQALAMLSQAFLPRNMIYCSPSTADAVLTDPEFGKYGLAVAHYGVTEPRIPKPWTTWSFWQHSSSGRVNGIEANVDLDWFNGDDGALQGLLKLPT
jgi:GH25 family lysozyme M1 (1,4-beta-N-acetylmuramidase)